jgi:hypothetical protein
MEIAAFIASAMAGAVLKGIATDAYAAVKTRLIDHFGLGPSVKALESDPGDEDMRGLIEGKLVKSRAIEDAVILDEVEKIAAELEKLPADTPLGATLTVRDFSAGHAEFRNNRIRAGGSATFEGIAVSGNFIVEGNEIGDDRKR